MNDDGFLNMLNDFSSRLAESYGMGHEPIKELLVDSNVFYRILHEMDNDVGYTNWNDVNSYHIFTMHGMVTIKKDVEKEKQALRDNIKKLEDDLNKL